MILGGFSATGPREANEDSYYTCSFSDIGSFSNGVGSFAMVSDGMGGYQGGDVASSLAVSSAEHYISNLLDMAQGNQVELEPGMALQEIVRNAHDAILAETAARGNASMGATFVGAFISPTHAWIGHVGDSRAYLIRQGEVSQLTEDHSQVGRMLSQGLITEEEAQNHPARNRIERALGFSDYTMDLTEVELQAGDGLLLCSDGVYTVLDAPYLAACISRAADAKSAARAVVKEALRNNTDDNSTAVVAFDAMRQATRRIRRPAPTIKMAPVSETRRQVRVGSTGYSRGGAAQPYDRYVSGGSRRSMASIVIPVAVFMLLAVGVGVLVVRANKTGARNGIASESAAQTQSEKPQIENTQQQDSNRGESSASTQNSDVPTNTSDDTTSYSVTEEAVLRYVDSDGYAWRFSEQQLGLTADPAIVAGFEVKASTSTDTFGRSMEYRQLDDKYLDDLMSDVRSCQRGATSFDSRFSGLFESGAYANFVQELSQLDTQTLSNTVRHLALRSSDLAQDEEWDSSVSQLEDMPVKSDFTSNEETSAAWEMDFQQPEE